MIVPRGVMLVWGRYVCCGISLNFRIRKPAGGHQAPQGLRWWHLGCGVKRVGGGEQFGDLITKMKAVGIISIDHILD